MGNNPKNIGGENNPFTLLRRVTEDTKEIISRDIDREIRDIELEKDKILSIINSSPKSIFVTDDEMKKVHDEFNERGEDFLKYSDKYIQNLKKIDIDQMAKEYAPSIVTGEGYGPSFYEDIAPKTRNLNQYRKKLDKVNKFIKENGFLVNDKWVPWAYAGYD